MNDSFREEKKRFLIAKNKTKNIIVSENVKEITSFTDTIGGLLIPSNPRSLLFHTRFGIHTFGLKVPIDVLILDNFNNVVVYKIGIKPNKIFMWNPLFHTVLELPFGTIKKSKTKLGDTLIFMYKYQRRGMV